MNFSDIKALVEERIDRRSIAETRHARWANVFRKAVATDFEIAGFRGLFFLYKEATIVDGSVKDQSQYEIPDDFIDDLNVFVDGKLLTKTPAGILDITQDVTDPEGGTPRWMQMKGQYFEIIPPPDKKGLEIKLFYNAMPDMISSSNNDDFGDYFLKSFPMLHVYGMTEQAVEGYAGLGASQGARMALRDYGNKLRREKRNLMIHNRRFHMKNARIRIQNWDEFQEKKRTVFPQFQET